MYKHEQWRLLFFVGFVRIMITCVNNWDNIKNNCVLSNYLSDKTILEKNRRQQLVVQVSYAIDDTNRDIFSHSKFVAYFDQQTRTSYAICLSDHLLGLINIFSIKKKKKSAPKMINKCLKCVYQHLGVTPLCKNKQ